MNTPIYQVATIFQKNDGKQYYKLLIDHWRPEGAVGPETYGQLLYIPKEGLNAVFWCYEDHPRAVYHKPNDPVHTDSCVEIFLNVFPEVPEYGYISIEMNHNGASHCSFGTDRYNRAFVLDMGLSHPKISIRDFKDERGYGWQAECVIRKSLLEALYHCRLDLKSGHVMMGNFYKCGDKTEKPHWGTWAPIQKLDFHTPESFGSLIIQ